jgi:small GTP-binding protein
MDQAEQERNKTAFEIARERIEEARRTGAERLDLEDLNLTELPEEIGCLTNLQTLALRWNQLSVLPESIGNLANLQTLYLRNNLLAVLPESIGNLTNLQTLEVCDNLLAALPGSIGNLTNLQILEIWNNQLTVLPESIGNLTNLQILSLWDNQLKVLPESIGKLASLQELISHDNQLTTLPKSFCQLTNLQELWLSGNQLTELPESFGHLASLQELCLENNQLTALPESINQFKQLKGLYLHGNDALTIPPEILGLTRREVFETVEKTTDPAAILYYYFRIHPPTHGVRLQDKVVAQVSRPLNEAKVILVGEGDVGKTSLVHQLLSDEPAKPDRGKTRGIDIHGWKPIINDIQIRVSIWDFGGQEIMHATHQMFLTKRSVYILVLDSRRSEEANRLTYWLKIIQSFSDGAPVLVVCNCCDTQEMDLGRQQLQKDFPNIVGFIMRVSCTKSEGIADVREQIREMIDNLPNIHDRLPLTWFKVKQHLENLRKNQTMDYLPYEAFEQICSEKHVEDKDRQQLLDLLHQLGTVLYFGHHNVTQNLSVLNPDWITKGIYEILNSEKLFQRHACLDDALLEEILDGKVYPREKRWFLVEMMREFELCFFFDGERKALVPDRLRKDEPETGPWGDTLDLQFRLPVLPGSIITRFIVRQHERIDRELFWLYGVVLRNPLSDGNRAIIRSDREAGVIYIKIDGNKETRRDFLRYIRMELIALIKTISGLKYEERVPLPGEDNVTVNYQFLCELENVCKLEKEVIRGDYRFEGAKRPHSVSMLLNSIEEPEQRRSEGVFNNYGEYFGTGASKMENHQQIGKQVNIGGDMTGGTIDQSGDVNFGTVNSREDLAEMFEKLLSLVQQHTQKGELDEEVAIDLEAPLKKAALEAKKSDADKSKLLTYVKIGKDLLGNMDKAGVAAVALGVKLGEAWETISRLF